VGAKIQVKEESRKKRWDLDLKQCRAGVPAQENGDSHGVHATTQTGRMGKLHGFRVYVVVEDGGPSKKNRTRYLKEKTRQKV